MRDYRYHLSITNSLRQSEVNYGYRLKSSYQMSIQYVFLWKSGSASNNSK